MDTFRRILLVFLSFYVFEHIATQLESDIKPSSIILSISTYIGNFTYMLGLYIAKICSFPIYLGLEKFGVSIWNLTSSFCKLIMSFFEWIPGYFETALTYIDKSYMIYLGSFILLMLFGHMVYIKTDFLKKNNNIVPLYCFVLLCVFVCPYILVNYQNFKYNLIYNSFFILHNLNSKSIFC